MVSELSVVWISVAVIVLCWAVVRVNQKIDEMIRSHKYSNTLETDQTDESGTPHRREPAGSAQR